MIETAEQLLKALNGIETMNREERRRLKKTKKAQSHAPSAKLTGDLLSAFNRAKELFEAGDFDQADELCQDVSAGAPLDAAPFHLRALIQYRLGHLKTAGEMILEAITRNDDDPEIHANCGAIMNMLGRYPEAEAACRHALDLSPRRADGYSNLAVALEMQGRYEEAVKACSEALKLRPDYPEARINLGNLLVRSGDLIGAIEAYSKGLELSPDNPTAYANMSVALLRLEEAEAAEGYAREALARNADYPEALNALGNALASQNRFAEALEVFDQVLTLQPNSFEAANNRAAALHKSGDSEAAVSAYKRVIIDGKAPGEIFTGLGVSLLSIGKIDDAVDAFRSAIVAKPDMGEAFYNLASALGSSLRETETQQITALLENPETPEKERVLLNFAMGEVADKRGQYEQAFGFFKTGNDLRKQLLEINEISFVPDEFDEQIASIIQSYPKGFLPPGVDDRSDNEAPVFIVGMPRSGTTLVEQIICAHPNAKSLGEAATFLADVEDFDADLKDLKREAEICFKADDGIQKIVDKTPFHFLSIGLIEQVYSKARILHCQRNPDDVALSCYFQNFASSYAWATDYAHIQRYQKAEQSLMEHWKNVSQLPLLTVSYEDMVTRPEQTTRQILKFLDLDWDETCLNFHTSGGASLSASNWQVRKPLYQSSMGRAKSYASALEVDVKGS